MIFVKSSQTSSLIRIILALLLVHGHLTVWPTFKSISGYPTTAELPSEFELVYGRVVEEHDTKFIELWVKYDLTPMGKFTSFFTMHFEMEDITRVFRTQYTKENHEFIIEMTKRITEGSTVGIKLEDGEKKRQLDLHEGEKDFRVEYENKIITK